MFYSNNNIYGKLMFSVDASDKLRIHIMKDIEEGMEELPQDFI